MNRVETQHRLQALAAAEQAKRHEERARAAADRRGNESTIRYELDQAARAWREAYHHLSWVLRNQEGAA